MLELLGRGQQRRAGLRPDQHLLADPDQCQFTALRYFAHDGTDHRDHDEQNSNVPPLHRMAEPHTEDKARRVGLPDCWHGSPLHPLLGFLTEASAARVLPDRPLGSLSLVGHTHEPALFAYDGASTLAVRPVPGESYDWLRTGACMANPGAVCGNPRDAASWWLIVYIDARVLRWQREEL